MTEVERVVIVTADDVPAESTARASALALAAAGLNVTILGSSSDGMRTHTALGSVRIIRVPVQFALRDASEQGRERRRSHRIPLGYATPEAFQAARKRVEVRRRDAELATGLSGRIAQRGVDVRLFLVRGRAAAGARADRAVSRAWRKWDASVGSTSTGARARAVLPEVDDYELAFGSVLDNLEPEVIQADDVHVIGVCARAAARARAEGRDARLVYAEADGTDASAAPDEQSARVAAALKQHESEFISSVDVVIARQGGDASAEAQSGAVLAAYRDLLQRPDDWGAIGALDAASIDEEPWSPRHGATTDVVLGIGPANSAGQAWAWAEAAERLLPDVRHDVIAITNDVYGYPSDHAVSKPTYAKDGRWAVATRERALSQWTHALMEAGRPIFGLLEGKDFRGDLAMLRAAGIEVGLVFHGSEIRNPRAHAASHRFSPFADPNEALTLQLQQHTDRLLPLVAEFDGPRFVSTPDQLDYIPDATWLPVVVDTRAVPPVKDVLSEDVPLVVHAPSNQTLKGTPRVEEVLEPLAAAGRIRYERIQGVQPADMAAALARADVVVDQLLLGLYGVLACEGMALGRVVVAHVGETLRSRVPAEIPIVETDPDSFGETIERIIDDRAWARGLAAAGPEFVEQFHDGRYSANVLAKFLGLPTA